MEIALDLITDFFHIIFKMSNKVHSMFEFSPTNEGHSNKDRCITCTINPSGTGRLNVSFTIVCFVLNYP